MERNGPGDTDAGSESHGLFQSLRDRAAAAVGLARTRLELLSVELQEEKLRLLRVAILTGAAAFFLALGVLVATLFVILLFWDTNRLLAAGLIAALYLLIGVGLAFAARNAVQEKTTLFESSMAELEKDRDQLTRQE